MKSIKVFKEDGTEVFICPGCRKEFKSARSAGAHIFQCESAGGGVSEETRNKLSLSKKGKPLWSEEQKIVLGEKHKRENLSEETLCKMSNSSSKKWTRELREQHSQKMSQVLKGNQYRKGIPHTQETKDHLSEVLTGREVSDEERKNKSLATRKTILNGTWNGFKNDDVGFYKSIRCKYKNCYFRSRYEAIFACWLYMQNLEFEYETIRLPYTDGSGKIYIPDFYIIDTNEVVEVKGRTDLDDLLLKCRNLVNYYGFNYVEVVGNEIWEAYSQLESAGFNIKELYDKSKEVWVKYKKGLVNDVLNFDIVGNKIIFI